MGSRGSAKCLRLCVVTVLGLLAFAAPSQATTTQIGEVAPSPAGSCVSAITFVQDQIAPGTAGYAVPAGGGVVTSWSINDGPSPGTQTVKLKVFRRTANPAQFTVVGESATETTVNSALNVFSTRISVQAGDIVGLRVVGSGVTCTFGGTGSSTRHGIGSESAVGATETISNTSSNLRINVAASVESDFDKDGLGDDTQDLDDDNDGAEDDADAFPFDPTETVDSDVDGKGDNADDDDDNDLLSDANEVTRKTSRLDKDSDDDGLSDLAEVNLKTRPDKPDTDGDRLADGLERGVTKGIADPAGPVAGTNPKQFHADRNPHSKTNPRSKDTDHDGRTDGREDRNHNGRRDRGETNPSKRNAFR